MFKVLGVEDRELCGEDGLAIVISAQVEDNKVFAAALAEASAFRCSCTCLSLAQRMR